MKYIKVTNYASQVNRLHLEKLGLSTKRDNDATIGQFGSGVKFAPIAAIRKGMRWVFAGADSKGSYLMELVIKDDEGIPSVFYKYEDYEKPSSFSADAGLLSWQSDFQIYREVIANAIDESTESETPWTATIVDESEIKYTEGEFSVFISATESLLEIHKNFDKYFSVNRIPVYEYSLGGVNFKLYNPIDDKIRVYSKGVLVYTSDFNTDGFKPMGIFDYEFASLELNEERTVKYNWQMNGKIIEAITAVDDDNLATEIMEVILNENHETSYYELASIPEYNIKSSLYTHNGYWTEIFEHCHPLTVALDNNNASVNMMAAISAKGYKSVNVMNNIAFIILKGMGVPTCDDVVSKDFLFQYDKEISNYPKLAKCIEIVTSVWSDSVEALTKSVSVITNEDEVLAPSTKGITLDTDGIKIIAIPESHASNGSYLDIIATLIHEVDHYNTGYNDGDDSGRVFRDLADKRLAKITLQMFQNNGGNIEIDWMAM